MNEDHGVGTDTQALVERARGGDREAYEDLFARAAEGALLFARLRLGPRLRERLDSLDVLQEAYLEAHRAFERFEPRGEGSFARWLCRIIENRIRGLADHHGAKRRNAPGSVSPVSRVIERLRGAVTDPGAAAARSEERSRLAAALEDLSEDAREIVLLRVFAGRTLDEIATATARSRNGVRRRLGVATARLGGLITAGAATGRPSLGRNP